MGLARAYFMVLGFVLGPAGAEKFISCIFNIILFVIILVLICLWIEK